MEQQENNILSFNYHDELILYLYETYLEINLKEDEDEVKYNVIRKLLTTPTKERRSKNFKARIPVKKKIKLPIFFTKLRSKIGGVYDTDEENYIIVRDMILSNLSDWSIPQPGLIVNGKQIERISGPVSFYYLKPDYNNKEVIELKQKGLELPLLLLFGDIHNSTENICRDCSKETKCTKLSDPYFLQNVDVKGSTEYPVDIYSELFFDQKKILNNIDTKEDYKIDDSLMEFMIGHMECFRTSLRGTSGYKCLTRNIRWNYADIRKHSKIWNDLPMSPYTRNMFLGRFNDNSYNIEYIKQSLVLLNNKNIDQLSKLLFNHILNNPTSVLKKQLEKQVFIPEFWRVVFVQSLTRILKEDSLSLTPDEMDKFMSNYLNYTVLLPNDYAYNVIDILVLRYNSTIVDLYTLMRLFKNTSRTSSLGIIYLGDDHITNMVWILSEYLKWYKVSVSIDSGNNSNRCLSIVDSIDLDKDLAYHNSLRSKLSKQQCSLTNEQVELAYNTLKSYGMTNITTSDIKEHLQTKYNCVVSLESMKLIDRHIIRLGKIGLKSLDYYKIYSYLQSNDIYLTTIFINNIPLKLIREYKRGKSILYQIEQFTVEYNEYNITINGKPYNKKNILIKLSELSIIVVISTNVGFLYMFFRS